MGSPLGKIFPALQLERSLLETAGGVPLALPSPKVLLPPLPASASNTYSPGPGAALVHFIFANEQDCIKNRSSL